MFGRTLGGFVLLFGAGAANAQVPAQEAVTQPTATARLAPIVPLSPAPIVPLTAPIGTTQAPAATTQPPATLPATPSLGAGCTDLTCSAPCPKPCCVPCCYPPGRVWVSAEWLFAATSGQSLPPLVTSSNTGGTGALVPGNNLLFGNQRVNNGFRNGLILNGGVWLDQCHKFGIEGNFLYLGNSSQNFAAGDTGAAGSTLVARPFLNAITGLPDSELVAAPGFLSGTVTVNAQNSVIGGGFNFRHNLCCTPCGRVDLLYGYQYLNVTDDVTITENLTTTAALPNLPAGFNFLIRDHFRTENNFNGGLIGLAGERRYGSIIVGARASVALGANHEVVTIDGATVSTPPGGAPTVGAGGLLTQTSNIGRYERTTFAVLPQLGLKLGVQVTNNIQLFGGYNFIYLSNVARAGDQIDLRVNPNLLPPANGLGGPQVPASAFKTTDFWIQGVSFGARLSY